MTLNTATKQDQFMQTSALGNSVHDPFLTFIMPLIQFNILKLSDQMEKTFLTIQKPKMKLVVLNLK